MVTHTQSDHRDLHHSHVWACPVYVLDPTLQNGKKLPKWNRRARMGQFLSYSNHHSSTVVLVRNLHTGYVSPQYHVVFDDKFQAVFHDGKYLSNRMQFVTLYLPNRVSAMPKKSLTRTAC
jgi:predicted chitinase